MASEHDIRGRRSRHRLLAAVLLAVPAVWAAALYFPAVADQPATGAAALAAVETCRGAPLAPGGHPVLPLLGNTLLSAGATGSAGLAAALASALVAVLVAPLVALACLETARAARAPSGWSDQEPRACDFLCCAVLACACVGSTVAVRQATQGGWVPAGLGVAAGFLAVTQRWRRMGRLDPRGALALGFAAAVGLTGEAGFVLVPFAGLLPVWFTALSRPRADATEASRGRVVPFVCFVSAALVGSLPAIVTPVLWTAASCEMAGQNTPGALGSQIVTYFAGSDAFNVGVDAATVAARDGLARLGRNLGPGVIVGVALAVVWASVFRSASGEDSKGRAVSAGLWPGALLAVGCWTLGWSYTGHDRDARLSLCLLGLCMCASVGWAIAVEMLEHRLPRALAPLVVALALSVSVWSLSRVPEQWGESRSGAAHSYAVMTLTSAPAGCVFAIGDEIEPVDELVWPLIYCQEVLGIRPDVRVIVAGGTPSPPPPLPGERGVRAQRGRGEGLERPLRFTDWRAARDSGRPVCADGHFLAEGPGTGDTQVTSAAVAAAALSGGAASAEATLRLGGRPPTAREACILAEAWADEGNWERAHDAARAAIALDSMRPDAWRVLGEALLHLEGTQPAEKCLRVAVALSRKHPDERASRLLAQLASGPES